MGRHPTQDGYFALLRTATLWALEAIVVSAASLFAAAFRLRACFAPSLLAFQNLRIQNVLVEVVSKE